MNTEEAEITHCVEDTDGTEKTEIEERITCLYLLFRRSRNPFSQEGDYCLRCEYNPEENPLCSGYYPVKIWTFYVKE